MKILQLHRQSYGGIATHVDSINELLNQKGFFSHEFNCESQVGNLPSFWSDRAFVKWLREYSKDFDLVHAHGYMPAWVCSELNTIPWIYTAHSVLKNARYSLIKRLNRSRAGICVSSFLESELSHLGASRLKVIPGGILLPQIEEVPKWQAKQRFAIPDGIPVIGGLGRLVKDKGFDTLIKAMKEVWWEFEDAILLISGEGPEWEKLNDLKLQSQKPENIRLLGKWSIAQELYQTSDLFVMPSRSEALGLAAIEAMSLGTPVLARRTGGLAEVLEEGVSGKYFEGGSSELAISINQMLETPTLLEAMASAARARAFERFDLSKNLDRIIDVYLTATKENQ